MAGIEWRSDFIEALEAMHPNTPVRAAQVRDSAGHLAREWRAMQADAERLAKENERLSALVSRLVDAV